VVQRTSNKASQRRAARGSKEGSTSIKKAKSKTPQSFRVRDKEKRGKWPRKAHFTRIEHNRGEGEGRNRGKYPSKPLGGNFKRITTMRENKSFLNPPQEKKGGRNANNEEERSKE